jgi:hypothetical protein
MNMLGFGLAVKGMNEMSRRGGGHRVADSLTEEEYFLADCLRIIRECAKMPEMQDTILPVSTIKKRTLKQKIKGAPKEETREIYFAQINPRGIRFDGIETHTGFSPVVGVIDNNKLFVYSKSPEYLEIYVVEEFSYDQLGDYDYCTGNVVRDGLSEDVEDVRVKQIRVANGTVKYDGSWSVKPSQNKFSVRDNWVLVADIVGKQRKACLERNREPSAEELGE